MSIFTSLTTVNNALNAASIGIRTAGHNISNAGNEDYNRQRVKIGALPPSPHSNLFVGTGVEVARLERIVNDRVELSLRNALSQFQFLSSQQTAFDRLEGIFNELHGSGLEEAMNDFFAAVEELFNRPEDTTTRRIFTLSAGRLADTFRARGAELRDLRETLNFRVDNAVQAVNSLTSGIAELNREIASAENGSEDVGIANDLRDLRDAKVRELAGFLEVRAVETSNGAVTVTIGSHLLVDGGNAELLTTTSETDVDVLLSNVEFVDTGKRLRPAGGAIGGRFHRGADER